MSIVSMKALLESGVHFGHQTRRWNPKMKQFIFTARNGIHIIDLQKTMQRLRVAFNSMKEIAEAGGKVLFVGTKKQAQAAIVEYAEKCGMFYVSERWLGGLLTNFNTVSRSIKRLKDIEKMNETDIWDAETKKEILELKRELAKKNKVLSGIKDMYKLPDAMFIIDPKREAIAVKEARKLRIPIYAVVDTNCNPDEIDYPIPGNDDAIRAIALFLEVMSRAIVDGQSSGQVEEEDLEEEFMLDEDALDEDALEDALDEEKVDVKGYIRGEDAGPEEAEVNEKEEIKDEVKDNEKEDVLETDESDKIEELKEEEKKDAAPMKEVEDTVEADKKEESIDAAEEDKETQLSKNEPDKGEDSTGSYEGIKPEDDDENDKEKSSKVRV